MKRPRIGWALAVLLAARVASAQVSAEERAAWNQPIAPFRVIDNVHYVGVAGVSAFLITTPQGHVLLDGGFSESAPRIEAAIAALGFKVSDIKVLINSHAHFDHAGGLAALARDSGAQVIASRADGAVLRAGARDLPAVAVARLVGDGDTVQLGGVTLTAHLTPGHTRGCTTWTMPAREGGKVWNVLFHCSTTFPGYELLHNADYPNIVADYEHSFAVLRQLPCDVLLAPHGWFFALDEKRARIGQGSNPFIDPRGCREFLEESERSFHRELSRQRARR
jgi:metallo-beta-lactamase class B